MSLFGTFNQKRTRSEAGSPSAYANSLTKLLGMQQKSLGNAITGIGDSRKGIDAQKISKKLTEKETEKLSPENFSRLMMEITGGQSQNKQTMDLMGNILGEKEKTQSNTWKEDAATTLFGRQNLQIDKRFSNSRMLQAQSNANAINRMKLNHKYTQSQMKKNGSNIDSNKAKYLSALMGIEDEKTRQQALAEGFVTGNLNKQDRIAMDKLGLLPNSKQNKTSIRKPRFRGKLYNRTNPEIRSFIDSKFGADVTETDNGYMYKGQLVTKQLLDKLKRI